MASKFERQLEAAVDATLEEAVRVAEITAPTFEEHERARYVEQRFAAIGGWGSLTRDRMGNVVAIRRGERGRGGVLAAAHLDTVFPDTEVSIRRARGKLLGPGIGDNALSVAAVLSVGAALQAAPPRGVGDILLATNAGEEGRGDLRGMRAICKNFGGQFDRVIAVEGACPRSRADRVRRQQPLRADGADRGRPLLGRVRAAERDPVAGRCDRGAGPDLPGGRRRTEDDDERRPDPRGAVGEHDRAGRDGGDRSAVGGHERPGGVGPGDEACSPRRDRRATGGS